MACSGCGRSKRSIKSYLTSKGATAPTNPPAEVIPEPVVIYERVNGRLVARVVTED